MAFPDDNEYTFRVRSSVKQDGRLLKLASKTFEGNARLRSDANRLIERIRKGNLDPGIGTKNIFGDILEARSRSGARVYFRRIGGTIQVVTYSNKSNQRQVISRLRRIYGH